MAKEPHLGRKYIRQPYESRNGPVTVTSLLDTYLVVVNSATSPAIEVSKLMA